MNELIIDDIDYLNIIEDIIYDEEFLKMMDYVHHGDNRYLHSLRVSYYSYKITKALHLDYVAVARAALLHDFFYSDNSKLDFKKKVKMFYKHPKYALRNAKKISSISIMEENIILSHMFPIGNTIPKFTESWVVDLVDDYVSILEGLTCKRSSAVNYAKFRYNFYKEYFLTVW